MKKNKTSDHQEEIDVFRFLKLISQFVGSIIKKTMKLVFEIFAKWKILLVITVIAYILGIVYENKSEYQPEKEGSILVNLNHGSSIYFYNSIDLLQKKISSGDISFFSEKLQFNSEEVLLEIYVEPIISSKGFFELFEDHNQMKVLINNTDDLDETIKYDIKQHKMYFLLSNGSSSATVDKIMRYLSSNPIYEAISNVYTRETLNKIEESNKTIRQINKLIEKYSAQNPENGKNSQVYFDGKTENVTGVLTIKSNLIEEIAQSKTDLIVESTSVFRYDEEVALIPKKKYLVKKQLYFQQSPFLHLFSSIFLERAF
jgi:hypothetical protein